MLFCNRVTSFRYVSDYVNTKRSPTLDILKAARRLRLVDPFCDVSNGSMMVLGKKVCSKRVWEKAWQLQDVFWDSTKIIHRENDLLCSIMSHTRYMSWWKLSDV